MGWLYDGVPERIMDDGAEYADEDEYCPMCGSDRIENEDGWWFCKDCEHTWK